MAMDNFPSPETALERRGSWIVLGADVTHKRIACKCAICGHTCQIGAEALQGGEVVFCSGCASPRYATPDPDTMRIGRRPPSPSVMAGGRP
jgi:hypothetical protein